MPQFRYRAVTSAGELVAGQVEAPSHEEVIRRIEYLGHLPIDAQVASDGLLARGLAGRAPRSRDITIFLRQLALLIEAGLTLEAALLTLGDDANKAVVALRREPALVDLGRAELRRGVGASSRVVEPDLCRHGPCRRGVRKARGRAARHRRGSHPPGPARRPGQFGDPLSAVPDRVRRSHSVVLPAATWCPSSSWCSKTSATGSIPGRRSCWRRPAGCTPISTCFSAAASCRIERLAGVARARVAGAGRRALRHDPGHCRTDAGSTHCAPRRNARPPGRPTA